MSRPDPKKREDEIRALALAVYTGAVASTPMYQEDEFRRLAKTSLQAAWAFYSQLDRWKPGTRPTTAVEDATDIGPEPS